MVLPIVMAGHLLGFDEAGHDDIYDFIYGLNEYNHVSIAEEDRLKIPSVRQNMVLMLLTKCHLYDAIKQPKIIMHLFYKWATGKVKVFLDG